jgi:hypothetical protein
LTETLYKNFYIGGGGAQKETGQKISVERGAIKSIAKTGYKFLYRGGGRVLQRSGSGFVTVVFAAQRQCFCNGGFTKWRGFVWNSVVVALQGASLSGVGGGTVGFAYAATDTVEKVHMLQCSHSIGIRPVGINPGEQFSQVSELHHDIHHYQR